MQRYHSPAAAERGPAGSPSPSPLRTAHGERWGGRGSGSASLPHLFLGTATDGRGGECEPCRGCRQLRAGAFPAVPSRHRVPPGLPGARCHLRPPPLGRGLRARCVSREFGDNSSAPAADHAMLRAGAPALPRPRCPPPTWPSFPLLVYPRRGEDQRRAGGSGALTQGSHRR